MKKDSSSSSKKIDPLPESRKSLDSFKLFFEEIPLRESTGRLQRRSHSTG